MRINRQACFEMSVRGLAAQNAFSAGSESAGDSFCRYRSEDSGGSVRRCAAGFLIGEDAVASEGIWETHHMLLLKRELWEDGVEPRNIWDVDISDRAFIRELQHTIHDSLAAGPLHIGETLATRRCKPFVRPAFFSAVRKFASEHNLSIAFLSEILDGGAKEESQIKAA